LLNDSTKYLGSDHHAIHPLTMHLIKVCYPNSNMMTPLFQKRGYASMTKTYLNRENCWSSDY